jgi:hypothetical protein
MLISISFLSCSKKANNDNVVDTIDTTFKPLCERNNTGHLTIVSHNKYKFAVYLNNNIISIQQPYETSERDIPYGAYTLKIEQNEGFILYPITINRTFNMYQCDSIFVSY